MNNNNIRPVNSKFSASSAAEAENMQRLCNGAILKLLSAAVRKNMNNPAANTRFSPLADNNRSVLTTLLSALVPRMADKETQTSSDRTGTILKARQLTING